MTEKEFELLLKNPVGLKITNDGLTVTTSDGEIVFIEIENDYDLSKLAYTTSEEKEIARRKFIESGGNRRLIAELQKYMPIEDLLKQLKDDADITRTLTKPI